MLVSTTFVEIAPAPLKPIPAVPPIPAAIDAAADNDWMLAFVTFNRFALGSFLMMYVEPSPAVSVQPLPSDIVASRTVGTSTQVFVSV